jgi:hypothetical protein
MAKTITWISLILISFGSCQENSNSDKSGIDPYQEEDPINFDETSEIYSGFSTDSVYDCNLKINSDSSVFFIINRKQAWLYSEYLGVITHVKDTIYNLDLEENYGQYLCKAWYDDTIHIQRNPDKFPELDSAIVWFENGDTMKNKLVHGDFISYPIPKDSFNRIQNIFIETNHINPISEKPLIIGVPSRSSTDFSKGRKLEFEISLSGNVVSNIDPSALITGEFVMEKL